MSTASISRGNGTKVRSTSTEYKVYSKIRYLETITANSTLRHDAKLQRSEVIPEWECHTLQRSAAQRSAPHHVVQP